MTNNRRIGSASNWRYRVIKHYKRRAETFRDKSITKEGQTAWQEVVSWFDSILRLDRYVTKAGSIGLVQVEIAGAEVSEFGQKSKA